MKKLALLGAAAALALGLSHASALGDASRGPASATSSSGYCARPSAARIAALPRDYPGFYRELRRSFGRAWLEAAIVSYGEGTWHPWAQNGQYLGTFQMGTWARSRYGHSSTLPGQARAAARYWRDSGWSGWECKP